MKTQKIDDLSPVIDEMLTGTDRAAALVGAATLEHFLEISIVKKLYIQDEAFLKEFAFSESGPLRTFSSKITTAYIIGLYGEQYFRDINIIRKIRNDFAHVPNPISFSTPSIKSRVGEISAVKGWREAGHDLGGEKIEFVHAVAGISGMLLQETNFYTKPLDPPRLV